MGRIRFLLTSGVIILLLPLLGFPTAWERLVLYVLGAGIAVSALRMYRTERVKVKKKRTPKEIVTESFVENTREDVPRPTPDLPNENTTPHI